MFVWKTLLRIGIISLLLPLNSLPSNAIALRLPIEKAEANETEALAAELSIESSSYTGIVDRIDKIAQQITVLIKSQNHGNGSGAIVAKQGNTYYILTASHVVQQPDKYILVAPDGQQYQLEASQTIILEGVDLALVKFTSERTYSVATIADYDFNNRLWVFVCGFPKFAAKKQNQRLLTAGKVLEEEIEDFVAKDSYSLLNGYGLVYTNMSYAGMSGGPVLDSQGRVIGINTAAENEIEIGREGQPVEIGLGFSLGVPSRTFIDLVNKAKIDPEWLKIETSIPPELSQSDINAIEDSLLALKTPSQEASELDWLNYGNQLWRIGRIQEAIAAFDRAIALNPNSYRAYYGKGLALSDRVDSKRDREALAAFSTTTELAPNFYPAWRWQGKILDRLHEYSEALAAYDRAIAIDAKDFVLHIERGDILGELKRPSEAIYAYNEAIKIKPHYWGYNNRGNAYAQLQDYAKAIADFDRAIALQPKVPLAYTNRGAAYLKRQDYQKAIADFDRAISLQSDYASAYNNRGLAYLELKDYQKAFADLDRAISLQSDYADAYNNRGKAYAESADYPKALADFDRAIALQPDIANFYINRGLTYQILRDYQKAIADYNRAILLQPDDADVYNKRGLARLSLQNYQYAIADFDRAIRIDPNYAEAYGNRAITYVALGEKEKAIADLERAIELFEQQKRPDDVRRARSLIEQLQQPVLIKNRL